MFAMISYSEEVPRNVCYDIILGGMIYWEEVHRNVCYDVILGGGA